MTVYQSYCFCLAVVSTTAFIGDDSIEYAAGVKLVPVDYILTQSAEMTAWVLDELPASREYNHLLWVV